jgi:hypothetical protein
MEEGDEEQKLGFLLLRKLPGITTLEDLKRNVRVSLEHATDATFKLCGEILSDFLEVVLFIGQELPSDLAALWRPRGRWTTGLTIRSWHQQSQDTMFGESGRETLSLRSKNIAWRRQAICARA